MHLYRHDGNETCSFSVSCSYSFILALTTTKNDETNTKAVFYWTSCANEMQKRLLLSIFALIINSFRSACLYICFAYLHNGSFYNEQKNKYCLFTMSIIIASYLCLTIFMLFFSFLFSSELLLCAIIICVFLKLLFFFFFSLSICLFTKQFLCYFCCVRRWYCYYYSIKSIWVIHYNHSHSFRFCAFSLLDFSVAHSINKPTLRTCKMQNKFFFELRQAHND